MYGILLTFSIHGSYGVYQLMQDLSPGTVVVRDVIFIVASRIEVFMDSFKRPPPFCCVLSSRSIVVIYPEDPCMVFPTLSYISIKNQPHAGKRTIHGSDIHIFDLCTIVLYPLHGEKPCYLFGFRAHSSSFLRPPLKGPSHHQDSQDLVVGYLKTSRNESDEETICD